MSESYADLVRAGRAAEAIDNALQGALQAAGGNLALADEIGGLRLILQRVIMVDALEGDPYQAGQTVAALVESITQAVRTERLLRGTAADDLASAVDQVLADLGLGER